MQNRTKKIPDKCSTEQNNFQTYPKKSKRHFQRLLFQMLPKELTRNFFIASIQISAVQNKIIFQTYQKKNNFERHFKKLFSLHFGDQHKKMTMN